LVSNPTETGVSCNGVLPIFGDLPVGLFRADHEGILLSVNQALARILGADDCADLVGLQVDQFLADSGSLSYLIEMLGDSSAALQGSQIEIRRMDGTPIWVRANLKLFEDDGETFIEGAFDDISDVRSRWEETSTSHMLVDAVNEAHTRFVTGADAEEVFSWLVGRIMELSQSTSGFIVARDGREGRVLAAIGLQAYDAARRFDTLLDAGPAAATSEELEIPILRGENLIGLFGIGGRPGGYGSEYLAQLRPVLAACTTLIQANRVDVKRKSVEAELEYAETSNRAMLETAASGIVTASADGTIRSFNRAAERLFGYETSEIVGQNLKVLMPAPPRDRHERYIERYLKSGLAKVIGSDTDVVAVRKDGSTFPVHLAVSEYRVQGKQFFAGVITDISERVASEAALSEALEEAERATRAKTAFLASMSHEIRTPMNGVLGMAGMLDDTPLDEEQREYLDIIKDSGELLLGLINDILDFSKVESGRIELEDTAFDPVTLAHESLALIKPEADEKGLSLEVVATPDLPSLVGDAGRIRQILLNLLSNAIKFTEKGGVTIEVGGVTRGGFGELSLSVRDTGIGISSEKMRDVFHSFAQADVSTSRRYGGTGLGLAISKELAGLMSGDISVESEQGVGSVFTFAVRLPIGDSPSAGPRSTALETKTSPDEFDGSKLRILLAEDTVTNQRVISAMLAKYGFRIEVAGNGLEALEAVKTRPFDLVLMDVRMPEMDGVEATRRIRALNIQQPMIAAMTADVIQETVDLCFEAGMDEFLTKPIRVQEILDVIRSLPEPSDGPTAAVRFSSLEGLGEILEVDDVELIGSLAETYLTDLEAGLKAIAGAADADDAEAVMEAAHKLKSSSRLMGAPHLGDLAEVMETEAREGAVPDVDAFAAFVAESRRVTESLSRLLPLEAAS
jgi:PAS domain S-box-containing protein